MLLLQSLFFFLKRPLIDRCQIVTDTCETNVSKFVQKPFKSLLTIHKQNIWLKPLFTLHYLSLFQLPFTRSKFVQFMEDLAVITALTLQGSFGKHFVERSKNCYSPAQVGPYWEKLYTLSKIRSHTLIGCYWQSTFYSPLFILSATPPTHPSTPLYS